MTIAICTEGKTKGDLHWGYFRDAPDEMPAFVVQGMADSGRLAVVGDSLAELLLERCQAAGPKANPGRLVPSLQTIMARLGLPVGKKVGLLRRKKAVVASTFHSLGMVCPFDRKADIGYR